jgi:hypothetical protein
MPHPSPEAFVFSSQLIAEPDLAFTIYLFLLLIASVVLPDIYFSWHELTTRRRK